MTTTYTDPGCVWPLDDQPCTRRYRTDVAGLPLCTIHAAEAISIMLTGKTSAEREAGRS